MVTVAGRPAPPRPGNGTRLVLLGASGFLGSHVRRRAVAAGMDVVTAGRSELPDSPAHCVVDLATEDPARLAVRLAALDADVVVNCAGATGGAPGELAEVNVTGTYALVRSMLMVGRPPRLVHLGSAAEYAPSEPGTTVGETAPARPASAYGATKLAATRIVELGRASGLDAVVLRVFNPVGAGAPEAILPGRLVTEFRRAVTTGTEVCLGPLDAVRDFVDARDVADAALAAAQAPALSDALINVGSGTGVPARTLARELAVISGYDGPVREDSGGSPRSAGLSWQQADIRRARRALDWGPRHDLATSLTDLWEDCRDPVPG